MAGLDLDVVYTTTASVAGVAAPALFALSNVARPTTTTLQVSSTTLDVGEVATVTSCQCEAGRTSAKAPGAPLALLLGFALFWWRRCGSTVH
ncbi:MAG: hypothetical protein WCI05_07065 [Myxococcales bacterium]